MRIVLEGWAAGLSLVALAGACGGKAGAPAASSTQTVPPPPLEQVCNDLYDALDASSVCLAMPGSVGSRSRYTQFCASRLGAPGVPQATLSAAESCASALRGAAPTCAPIPAGACKVPAGALPAGAACGTALQCASGYCTAAGQTLTEGPTIDFTQLNANSLFTCGVCTDTVPIGGTCSGTYQCTLGCWMQSPACAAGSVCGAPSGSGATVTGSSSGPGTTATCVAVSNSASGASSSGGGASGKKLGEPCAVMTDCIGLAVCDPTTKVCTAPVHPPPGAPCGTTSYFCQSGVCMLGANDTGVCPPVLAEGQPCESGGSTAVCDDYAVCVTPQQVAGCCSSNGSGSSSGAVSPMPNEPTCVFFDPRTCK